MPASSGRAATGSLVVGIGGGASAAVVLGDWSTINTIAAALSARTRPSAKNIHPLRRPTGEPPCLSRLRASFLSQFDFARAQERALAKQRAWLIEPMHHSIRFY